MKRAAASILGTTLLASALACSSTAGPATETAVEAEPVQAVTQPLT